MMSSELKIPAQSGVLDIHETGRSWSETVSLSVRNPYARELAHLNVTRYRSEAEYDVEKRANGWGGWSISRHGGYSGYKIVGRYGGYDTYDDAMSAIIRCELGTIHPLTAWEHERKTNPARLDPPGPLEIES